MGSSSKHRVAIVTGGAGGIGLGIVRRLAGENWIVVSADLKEFDSDDAPEKGHIVSIKTDVSQEQDVRRLVDETRERFGRIDAIVSNAGVSEFYSLQECSLAEWNRVLGINLTAAFLLAREAEKCLRDAKGGLILIASTRAHMSESDTHTYSASKGGLVALTHSLAISLGPDVRVNCISPGWIHVGSEKLTEQDHAQHPVGRVGTPEDIAAAVSFLLSDQAGFITGTELVVDGGMTRKMIYQ